MFLDSNQEVGVNFKHSVVCVFFSQFVRNVLSAIDSFNNTGKYIGGKN